MRSIQPDPVRPDVPEGTVVFLIGMRFNDLRAVHRWLPVFLTMPRLLRELDHQPQRGLLGAQTWFGRTIVVVQYWRSMADLMAYARAADAGHLPAWRAFNRRGPAPAIGIWHEAYVTGPGQHHLVYRDMPAFGMAAATAGPAS